MSDKWVVFDLIGVLAEPSWRDLGTQEEQAWGAFKRGQKREHEFWNQACANTYRHMLSFRPDRLAFVRELKVRGFKICVATNFSRDWLEFLLEKCASPSLFDAKVVSSDIGAAKPEPAFWQEVLKHAPPGSVFVDDRRANCKGAEEAGFKAVWAHPACALEREVEERLG